MSSVSPGDHSLPKANIPGQHTPGHALEVITEAIAGGVAPDFRDT
jgi:hypothetical protein